VGLFTSFIRSELDCVIPRFVVAFWSVGLFTSFIRSELEFVMGIAFSSTLESSQSERGVYDEGLGLGENIPGFKFPEGNR
jgi:hypothetical protein